MGIELVVGQTNSEVIEIHPTVAAPPGPQGVKGDKGDPGGLVNSSSIADGVNINTLMTPGTYFRGSSVNSTIALNYPMYGWAGHIEVIGTATSIIQRATSIYSWAASANTARNMWYRTYTAGAWQAWTSVNLTATGTGLPEGVITAPIGTRYVDTVATSGAVLWTKTSGTGTTGWKVTQGDTGTRSVPTIAATGFTATSSVWRRMGDTVMASVIVRADAAFTSGGLAFTVPTGFRPAMAVNSSPPYSGIGPMSINVGGTANLWVAMSVNDQRAYSWTWLTADPWPTTLPGTAV